MTIEEQKYVHLGDYDFTGILENVFKLFWKMLSAKLVSDFLSNRKKKLTAGHNKFLLEFS